MTAPIRDMAGLVAAMRERRDELNLSHETIDLIAGVPGGYTSKLFANKPMKNLGYVSMGLLLGALGIGLEVVEDIEAIEQVKSRWQPRKRFSTHALSMPLSITTEIQKTPENQRKQRMQELGRKGGKRRMETMSKRARQRVATHAARKRWAKRREMEQKV